MSVMRWDPFRDLLSIQDEMNRLFRRTLGEGETGGETEARPRWAPALDIAERDDSYVVRWRRVCSP
jgi:HSP20 family protein